MSTATAGAVDPTRMTKQDPTDHHQVNVIEGESVKISTMSREEHRRTIRALDLRIIPYMSLLYLLSFLDRSAIGQAAVAGLRQDLNIVNGNAYAIALSVFFIPYILVETPSTLILKRVRPHRWIPATMIVWGIVMTLSGLVTSAAGLQASRFFLGLVEGGLFPCLNLLLTCWYARREQSFRIGVFFSGATLAGAFGGILAFGLKYIPFPSAHAFGDTYDAHGQPPGGWRFIFIVEGVLTVLCAIPGFWLLVDFPSDEQRILTEQQRIAWRKHLDASQGVINAAVPFDWSQVVQAFTDIRTYLYAVLYCCLGVPFYALSLFTPQIIAALNFSGASANLLSVPPFAAGFLATLVTTFMSDRVVIRGPFILFWIAFLIAGYGILISDVAAGVRYFALFLTVMGGFCAPILAITWVGGNVGPHYVRATTMGFFFTIGNGGALVSSNIYPQRDGPRFIKGHAVCLSFAVLGFLVTLALMFSNWRDNRLRNAISVAHPDGRDVDPEKISSKAEKQRWGHDDLTHDELLRLGHKHNGFRYIL